MVFSAALSIDGLFGSFVDGLFARIEDRIGTFDGLIGSFDDGLFARIWMVFLPTLKTELRIGTSDGLIGRIVEGLFAHIEDRLGTLSMMVFLATLSMVFLPAYRRRDPNFEIRPDGKSVNTLTCLRTRLSK